MKSFKQFFTEKIVIGLNEFMNLDGIGRLICKVDSGNGAYNVLHGEDIDRQGNKVIFTTYDDAGTKHKISKDIVKMITINVGAGHEEERPVVLFRVGFNNNQFDNVPFSIGNRSKNKHKVLVGLEFIKQLDALIDVDSEYIADDGVVVDY
jgi:hypothetical protein